MSDAPNEEWDAKPSRAEDARRWEAQLAMISDVGRIAQGHPAAEDLLKQVCETVRHGFSYYDVGIFLVDEDAGECVLLAQAGAYGDESHYGYRQQVGVGMVGWVAEHGETLLANDVAKEPRRIVAFEGEAKCRAELAVPIRLQGRTVGVVNVAHNEPNAFSERDVVALEAIADQLAQAIENSRMFNQARLFAEFHRRVLDSIPSGICVADAEGKILSANRRFARIAGKSLADLLGRNLRDTLPAPLCEGVGLCDSLQKVAEEGAARRWRNVATGGHGDGGGHYYNVRMGRVALSEGLAAVVVLEDVTQWHQAEERAERQRVQLDTVMRHTPVALATVDMQGRLTFWAAGNERLLGHTPAEVAGRPAAELFGSPAAFEALMEQARSEGTAEGDIGLVLKSGETRPFQASLSRLLDAAGRQTGFALCMLDVAERTRAAEGLRREQQKLNDVVNAMGAGLALIGPDRRILWANKRLEEWFGGNDRPVVGSLCHEIYCRSEAPCDVCVADRAFGGETSAEASGPLLVAGGMPRHFSHIASPVIGSDGKAEHVLKITQDITPHTKRIYQLSRLRQIGEVMQGMLDVESLLHFILTCATAGQALGFNRSLLFLIDEKRRCIEGRMAVGPASLDEARSIWQRLGDRPHTLQELLNEGDGEGGEGDAALTEMAKSVRIDLFHDQHALVQCVLNKRATIIRDARNHPHVPADFADLLGAHEFALAPLIARGEVLGVIEADNLYTNRPIEQDDVDLLTMFAGQAGIAIATAQTYRRLQEHKEELERAYAELAEADDKLLRSERLVTIGRMAAHVAHEIRNPLVTIGGFARAMLSDVKLNPKSHRRARIIADEVTRLETILKGVMDFARPPAPNAEMRDINSVARLSVRLVKDRAAEKRVQIRSELAEGLPMIWIDATQMQQVFLNVLSNALESMEEGGSITISTRPADGNVEVEIRNTGSFIPPNELPTIFEPFVTNKEGGTGLGLAICQKIVQDHRGTIEAKSSRSEGTSFVLSLPAGHGEGPPPLPADSRMTY